MTKSLQTIALIPLFIALGIDDPFVQAALAGFSLAAILTAIVVETQRSSIRRRERWRSRTTATTGSGRGADHPST